MGSRAQLASDSGRPVLRSIFVLRVVLFKIEKANTMSAPLISGLTVDSSSLRTFRDTHSVKFL